MKGKGVVIAVVVVIVIIVIALLAGGKGGGPAAEGPGGASVGAIRSELDYADVRDRLANFSQLPAPEQGKLLSQLSGKNIKWQGTVVTSRQVNGGTQVAVDMDNDSKPDVVLDLAVGNDGQAPAPPANGASITFTGVVAGMQGGLLSVQQGRYE